MELRVNRRIHDALMSFAEFDVHLAKEEVIEIYEIIMLGAYRKNMSPHKNLL